MSTDPQQVLSRIERRLRKSYAGAAPMEREFSGSRREPVATRVAVGTVLTTRRCLRELTDRVEIRCAAPERTLALFDRKQLEPQGLTGPALRQNREIGLTDNSYLWVPANRRRVGH